MYYLYTLGPWGYEYFGGPGIELKALRRFVDALDTLIPNGVPSLKEPWYPKGASYTALEGLRSQKLYLVGHLEPEGLWTQSA